MKRSILAGMLLLSTLAITHGQGDVSQNALAPVSYVVGESGPHSRQWLSVASITNEQGQVTTATNQAYVELCTGLMHRSANGQWIESTDEIFGYPGGSAATNGQHNIIFGNNLNTTVAIDMLAPDGKEFQSHILGLSYYDAASGSNVMVAEIQDCQGVIQPPNQVLYQNAFTDFKADVLYTYTRAGFEQDVILRERPPLPEAFGLNSASSVLQVLTEFVSSPQPITTPATIESGAGGVLPDESLDFGIMKIGPGRAFTIGQDELGGIPVAKEWTTLEGRTFLVEEVAVAAIAGQLDELPLPPQVNLKPLKGSVRHVVSNRRLLPGPKLAKATRRIMKVAKGHVATPGLVLDYTTYNSSQTNLTFQSDSTYYISGTVNLYGTNTFEGGAVLKYTNNASVNLTSGSSVNWSASAYRPVVMTSRNDNSVGAAITGSTGTPTNYYANPALSFANISPNLSYFRIAWAQQGIFLNGGTATLCHGQIVNSQSGIAGTNTTAYLRDLLLGNLVYGLNNAYSSTFIAENTTFTGTTNTQPFLLTGTSNTMTLKLTNCIVANISSFSPNDTNAVSGDHNGFYNTGGGTIGVVPVTSVSNPFQTVGAGNYYLSDGCGFFNAGTTNINSSLLSDIQQKTTYPPLVYSNTTFSANTTLYPQAQRDMDTPDLGYHYDPLDYLIIAGTLNSSVTLTCINGVGVGLAGIYGLTQGGPIVSEGRADAMNRLCWYPSVQEQSVVLSGTTRAQSAMFHLSAVTSVQMAFTDIAMLGQAQQLSDNCSPGNFTSITLNNCWLRGVNLPVASQLVDFSCGSGSAVSLQNNLFERSSVTLFNGAVQYMTSVYKNPLTVVQNNNLYWRGTLALSYKDVNMATCHPTWTNIDNLLDNTTFTFTGTGSYSSYITNANNGYYQTTDAFPGTNDLTVTNLTYATGPVGRWYIGSSSPTIVNAGSRTADLAGLYHYTLLTNLVSNLEIKETNSVVDIGFHYVATDTNGVPNDTDSDGMPDYLEDANGNGSLDSGETDWQSDTDPGLMIWITEPRENAKLP